MTGINEEVARLTGKLVFDVNTSPLQRFMAMLKAAEASMARVGKEATALQAKLSKAFNISGKGASAERTKLDASIRKSLDKELATEVKLSKLRRQQFMTEITQQKLIATGTRQESWQQTNALKDQQHRAVLAAKQQKAQQEALKTELGRSRIQASAEQSQLRQARLADILQKRQARTVQLQQQAMLQQTRFQRAELALNNARANGIRQAERWAASKAATANREARATERHQQQAQRFQFAAQRHEAWQARHAAPKPMDFGGLAVGLTAASAALYGLVRGVSYLSERVTQRQSDASGAEQFNTSLEQAGGKNKDNQKFARDQFISISDKYGMELSTEAARSFALFVQGQLALGKTLTQATKMFEDQSAVFRAAALDKEAQKRSAYQLNQIRAKGKPEGSDVNDLFDAVGGVVATSIRKAAAERLKFKGEVSELPGWFKQAVTDGKVLAKDFDQGLANFLKNNQDILAKQMNSISAAQQRSDNQAYLNDNVINASEELKGVILQRIESERQLNEALKPFKETLALFDIGLTKLATQMLRFGANRNVDGSEKTSDQQVQDKMSTVDSGVNTRMTDLGDYSAIDGSTQHQGGPIGKFWNWLFSVQDYRKGDANKAEALEMNIAGLQFPPLDLSKFSAEMENLADGKFRQFRPYQPYTTTDILDGAAARQRDSQPVLPAWLGPGDLNGQVTSKPTESKIDQSHTELHVEVNVDARGMGASEVEKITTESTRALWDEELRKIRAAQKEVE
ncbi:tape measure protein [Pseudomonas beijingensis]|uniref:tape measure protein n=1 Tax=Pseudomonas beijingensis TaxID=2954101 RepID=UPI0027366EA9|nr:tape measure protein [Pseudomonas sp. FP2262]WLH44232.1 tape measure protein [Pseudomonas sp. FP2262]